MLNFRAGFSRRGEVWLKLLYPISETLGWTTGSDFQLLLVDTLGGYSDASNNWDGVSNVEGLGWVPVSRLLSTTALLIAGICRIHKQKHVLILSLSLSPSKTPYCFPPFPFPHLFLPPTKKKYLDAKFHIFNLYLSFTKFYIWKNIDYPYRSCFQ